MHAVYHTNLDTRLRLERINSTSYAYICIYIYVFMTHTWLHIQFLPRIIFSSEKT